MLQSVAGIFRRRGINRVYNWREAVTGIAMHQIERKKELELFWLERAIKARPDLFPGEPTAGESPDFVLEASGTRTGIEITRFVTPRGAKPNPEQQVSLQARALVAAQRLFAQSSTTSLRVQAVFTHAPFASAEAVGQCSRDIAALLTERAASLPVGSRVECRGDDAALSPQIAAIHASVVPEPRFAHWVPASAGWARSATADDLARIAAEKATKIERYRENVGEVALLIVFEGGPKMGDSVHPPDEPVGFSLSTVFDRILCLDVRAGRVVVIPTSRPTA